MRCHLQGSAVVRSVLGSGVAESGVEPPAGTWRHPSASTLINCSIQMTTRMRCVLQVSLSYRCPWQATASDMCMMVHPLGLQAPTPHAAAPSSFVNSFAALRNQIAAQSGAAGSPSPAGKSRCVALGIRAVQTGCASVVAANSFGLHRYRSANTIPGTSTCTAAAAAMGTACAAACATAAAAPGAAATGGCMHPPMRGQLPPA